MELSLKLFTYFGWPIPLALAEYVFSDILFLKVLFGVIGGVWIFVLVLHGLKRISDKQKNEETR